ncbi:MAG: hypothetical protein AB1749_05505 [Pseudomonadota bacterium]
MSTRLSELVVCRTGSEVWRARIAYDLSRDRDYLPSVTVSTALAIAISGLAVLAHL